MSAENNKITVELIDAAQYGCKTSLSHLTEEAKRRVSVLLFRMTMDYHLTEDLTQETILDLVRSLKRLEVNSTKSFWSWVYRTAVGKLQHHNRIQGSKRIEKQTSFSSESLSEAIGSDVSPLYELIKKENIDIILSSMYGLKTEYRGVLSLRCIEGLSYTQIADIMGGTPLRVRMLFRHAKGSLKKQLARRGIGKSNFLQALSVFAVLTAGPSDKFSIVQAAGLEAAKLGIRTKVSIGVVSKIITAVIAVLVFMAGISIISNSPNSSNPPTIIPESVYDDSIRLIYDDPQGPYTHQADVLNAINPDGGNWLCFPWLDRPMPATEIKSIRDKPLGTYLVLPEGHSVEYLLTGPLVDSPGIDIAVQIWYWGELPDISLTDGAGKDCKIYPVAYRGQYPYMAAGFDLAQIKPDFEPKTIRVAGMDNEGPYGGCGLGNIAAYTKKDTPD